MTEPVPLRPLRRVTYRGKSYLATHRKDGTRPTLAIIRQGRPVAGTERGRFVGMVVAERDCEAVD